MIGEPSDLNSAAAAKVHEVGRALIKFISANDAGATGAHQSGFYLPKPAWKMFAPFPPIPGQNDKHQVEIKWHDGLVTKSMVIWYGRKKSEYRLTRFGRGFPHLSPETVGSLLVLVPEDEDHFYAFVLDSEDEIATFQAAVGIEPLTGWAVIEHGQPRELEDPDKCLARRFESIASKTDAFPTGKQFSAHAAAALSECVRDFARLTPDDRLMRCVRAEYDLFRMVERRLCTEDITGPFRNIDDFLAVAGTITQRRKSRAGRSLENHVERILREEGIPMDVRSMIEGRPDIVIPGKREYENPDYALKKLFVVGVKTTCKDRWGQVAKEAPRARHRYILTTQRGISTSVLRQMHSKKLSLIVPRSIQNEYPRDREIEILSVQQFVDRVRLALST